MGAVKYGDTIPISSFGNMGTQTYYAVFLTWFAAKTV